MKRLAVVLATVALFGVLTTSPVSAQTDAASVARALIAAENAHDVNAVVNMFAPGAVVSLPTGALVGRAEIEQWQRELAAGNFHAETTPPVAVTSEIVDFSGTVALDTFRQLGLASLESTWELTIQLGKVTIFNFNFTPAAGARLGAALAGAGGGGTAQSGGSQSGGGAAGSVATVSGATTSASSRSLALTGANLDLAGLAGMAILFGAALLLTDRGWAARSARGRRPVR